MKDMFSPVQYTDCTVAVALPAASPPLLAAMVPSSAACRAVQAVSAVIYWCEEAKDSQWLQRTAECSKLGAHSGYRGRRAQQYGSRVASWPAAVLDSAPSAHISQPKVWSIFCVHMLFVGKVQVGYQ